MRRNVLFLVNGLGLGNSTRCDAIIQALQCKGISVDIVTSGNGIWYFNENVDNGSVFKINALEYGQKDGKLDMVATLLGAKRIWRVLRGNGKQIDRILEETKPAAVVTDSVYTFLPMKHRGIPIIALNNADVVVQQYHLFKDRPASISSQFNLIERPDSWFHRVVPDLVISPTLSALPDPGIRRVQRVGPIVRERFRRTKDEILPCNEQGSVKQKLRILFMLSGSTFGTEIGFDRAEYPFQIDVIGRSTPDQWREREDIVFHGKVRDTLPFLRNADLAIINGGFSAVSEVFSMRIPALVVPVPRHAEQWVNGRTIRSLGVGREISENSIEAEMFKAIKEIPVFQAAYKQLPEIEDGAKEAADLIEQTCKNRFM